ncbi:unnamed protein product [Parnassius apollo]|uniref:(apollo) hypothetical protein n=1 Tax=Parnassius apollo TaxID=110799 RepID=A0A8S3W4K2_PARAO|nr:unnamed protein product [Parnassius apollo]
MMRYRRTTRTTSKEVNLIDVDPDTPWTRFREFLRTPHLRTVDDIQYPTYRAAYVARHLLDGDQQWDNALEEASISDSPSRLRRLFAVMLVFCGIANPLLLWEKYRHLLSEDFLRAPRCTTGDNTEATDERVLNSCLSSLQDMVISIGGSSLVDYGLPTP